MYAIYFRLMSTNHNTKFLNPLPSNSIETKLLQTEDNKHQVFTPKLPKCEEITILEVIELEDTQLASEEKAKQMIDIE